MALTLAGATSAVLVAAGQSFNTSLASGYTQDLFATTQLADEEGYAFVLGGVAFAPNGDVWSAECFFTGTAFTGSTPRRCGRRSTGRPLCILRLRSCRPRAVAA